MTKSAQPTIALDHSVAGDDQWDGIPAIGIPNGSEGFRMANRLCNVPIGSGLPVGNFCQCGPNFFLEWGPSEIQLTIKTLEFTF